MSLTLILGCMFSGKSSEILRRARRYMAIGESVTIINSAKDTRCSESVVQTHDKRTIPCMKTNLIEDALTVNSNVIVVDEGQFFTDMRATVEKLLAMGKTVIIGGLDGDFRQMPFGELFTLIPLADKVIKLSAICMICRDGTLAPFTKRIVTGTTQEMVGASDKYMAVCRKHLTT